MPSFRCHVCWNFLDYCSCVAQFRWENMHPTTTDDPPFMQISQSLDPDVVVLILQLMSGGLAHDRDTWIKRQTENLDNEIRDLLS